MQPFARLLDRLLLAPQRSVKQALIVHYLRTTEDPDRGYGLAALTGELTFKNAKAGLVRELLAARTDPVLLAWSYDFVGDLAETAALLWPSPPPSASPPPQPRLAEVVAALLTLPKTALPATLSGWLDALDTDGRFALLKLVTGALRVGASAGLAKAALAELGDVPVAAIEEAWHGLAPPYAPLFAWLEGRGPRPDPKDAPVFRPLMLAHPLEGGDLARVAAELDQYAVEWKWDGIRIQIAATASGVRLYSRTGDEVSGAFPELAAAVAFKGVVDGELLVGRAAGEPLASLGPAGEPPAVVADVTGDGGTVETFNALQQRLGRKAPTPAMLERWPVFVRLYDILFDGMEDLRALPFTARRARLEAFVARARPARIDLSPLVPATTMDELDRLRLGVRGTAREGLMLKRRDSPYLAGRPKGHWWKWKRDAHLLDVVVMYAQRGHGKRSSFYSDYTFGAWRDGTEGPELVPVGKAYSGFTDEELKRLDKWVRDHTVNRFGPVREVAHGLVLEVAFDDVQRSARHKSGVAMRFPRVHRIRWDKPAAEADRLDRLEALIGHGA